MLVASGPGGLVEGGGRAVAFGGEEWGIRGAGVTGEGVVLEGGGEVGGGEERELDMQEVGEVGGRGDVLRGKVDALIGVVLRGR